MTEISFFVCVFVRQTATHSGCCCCKSKFTGSRCCRSVMGEYLSIYLLFFLRKIIPVYKVVISKEEIYWRNPRARCVSSWMPIDLPFWKVLLTELFNSSFWNSSSFYLKKKTNINYVGGVRIVVIRTILFTMTQQPPDSCCHRHMLFCVFLSFWYWPFRALGRQFLIFFGSINYPAVDDNQHV